MARIFITGSVDGLGRAAAESLADEGHEIVLHARNATRAADLGTLADRATAVVTGDLSSAEETRSVAEQVNAVGRMDAVIHNAGVYIERERGATPEGHARTFAINTLAPYLLTALIERPDRLVYLSSGLHRSGTADLGDLDWNTRRWDAGQAYADSKLLVTTLAAALARRWPGVRTAAVDPGWMPTKMGGPSATGDLSRGHLTQVWFATAPEAEAAPSGAYWFDLAQRAPHPAALDPRFQDESIAALADLTGERLGPS